jgi:creatinine amidohydrolase/Fe(II)-dependent formamide hydrolase-like protein
MVPSEVVMRRTRCPIAYLPVGALEWHGSHLPFGTDGITVEHIAVRTAKQTGGVVFPPILYGDCRYRLQEHRPEWLNVYRKEMTIPEGFNEVFVYGTQQPKGYRTPKSKGAMDLPFAYQEQMDQLVRHIAYVLMEITLYGFSGIVLLPGHGPTTGSCHAAVKVFQENIKKLPQVRPIPDVKVFAYLMEAVAIEPALKKHWIHADKIETSLLKVLEPKSVHPELLSKNRKKIPTSYLGGDYLKPDTGYNPAHRDLWSSFDAMDPRKMSVAYGRKILNFSVKSLVLQVKEMSASLKKENKQ